MEPSAKSCNLVVKVKYGETLKRFGASIYGNSMDFNMMTLRIKIIDLFKLQPDSHLALTYIDEDGDTVALDTDDELCDAVISQHLNPLRISVQFPSTTTTLEPGLKADSKKLTTTSPQEQIDNVQHITSTFDDALNSIQEQFRGAFSEVYHDSFSKSVPAVAEIVDLVSKLAVDTVKKHTTGQSSGTSGDRATTPRDINISREANGVNSVPVKTEEEIPEPKDEEPISKNKDHVPVRISTSTRELPAYTNYLGYPFPDNILAPSYFSGCMLNQDKGKGSAHDMRKPHIATSSKLNPPELIPESHLHTSKLFELLGKSAEEHNMLLKCANASAGENSTRLNYANTLPEENSRRLNYTNVYTLPEENSRRLNYTNLYPSLGLQGDTFQYRVTNSTGPESPFFFNYPPVTHSHRKVGGYHDNMLRTFHKGVRCDACGMNPIIGARFKSKVKENYDLCNLCFMEMGSEADYVRIDKANHTSHKPLRELYNSHSRHRLAGFNMHGSGGRSSRGKLESRFIQDVTVLDGTLMAPSTPFTKIWRMRNNGTIQWPYGTQLVWVGGDQFSTNSSVNLVGISLEGYPVEAEIDIAVDFVSPSMPGRYVSYWRLASPSGQKFGQRVWVLIQVENSRPSYSGNLFTAGLNLNLPPENNTQNLLAPIEIMDDRTDFFGTVNNKPEPSMKPDEMSGLYNNGIKIGAQPARSDAVALPIPEVPEFSYPIIDLTEPETHVAAAVASMEVVTEGDEQDHEQALLKELENMGFKQIDLNKEILRLNEYDLEQSVDDLCGYAEWDPLLSELREMGFADKEKNKNLLIKHGGSIKRVVMDLVAEENA